MNSTLIKFLSILSLVPIIVACGGASSSSDSGKNQVSPPPGGTQPIIGQDLKQATTPDGNTDNIFSYSIDDYRNNSASQVDLSGTWVAIVKETLDSPSRNFKSQIKSRVFFVIAGDADNYRIATCGNAELDYFQVTNGEINIAAVGASYGTIKGKYTLHNNAHFSRSRTDVNLNQTETTEAIKISGNTNGMAAINYSLNDNQVSRRASCLKHTSGVITAGGNRMFKMILETGGHTPEAGFSRYDVAIPEDRKISSVLDTKELTVSHDFLTTEYSYDNNLDSSEDKIELDFILSDRKNIHYKLTANQSDGKDVYTADIRAELR